METRSRSVVKALLWNAIGLAVMTLAGFAVTGSLRQGGGLALLNTSIGFASYLAYERAWARFAWGRRDG
ncbi:DUF2061 domain-containing protein [Nocardioides marinus]|nr:DUF2061 domain-containing protein [Nocardioides marinus]